MGQDARWVCHTCKTVCSPGGRPIFRSVPADFTVDDILPLKNLIDRLDQEVELDNKERMISFLDDLQPWLSRHQTHYIHIGSDYSTDMMDLDDYRNESVNGKVSKLTRCEARCKSVDEWEATVRKEIGQIIRKHKDEIAHNNMDTIANELYQKFSMKEI